METKHYENISDKKLLVEGRYSHLTTVSEWSLNSVSAIIDSCSKALLGTKKSAPEGSQEGKQQSALNDLQVYEDQKQRYRKTIEKLGQKEMGLDIDDEDYIGNVHR